MALKKSFITNNTVKIMVHHLKSGSLNSEKDRVLRVNTQGSRQS